MFGAAGNSTGTYLLTKSDIGAGLHRPINRFDTDNQYFVVEGFPYRSGRPTRSLAALFDRLACWWAGANRNGYHSSPLKEEPHSGYRPGEHDLFGVDVPDGVRRRYASKHDEHSARYLHRNHQRFFRLDPTRDYLEHHCSIVEKKKSKDPI
jgi:hypothetical protein